MYWNLPAAWKAQCKFYKSFYEMTMDIARSWQGKCFKAQRWSAAWKAKAKQQKERAEAAEKRIIKLQSVLELANKNTERKQVQLEAAERRAQELWTRYTKEIRHSEVYQKEIIVLQDRAEAAERKSEQLATVEKLLAKTKLERNDFRNCMRDYRNNTIYLKGVVERQRTRQDEVNKYVNELIKRVQELEARLEALDKRP